MEGAPASKKRKITDLRAGLPFCSQSALAAICKEIAKNGLPEKHTRHAMWKETKEFLEDPVMSMYGPFFQKAMATTVCNDKQEVLFVNFLSLLAGTFHKNGAFTDFLLQAHGQKPSSMAGPWRCVVYADEMHPGNMLNSTTRKSWCTYISFLEMGKLLGRSDCWFCISINKSTEVSNLAAGMSQVFRLILEDIFGQGLPETGVLLTSPKGNVRIHFTLGMVLQDGAAHKHIWANRQDTGSKPCFHCNNIFYLRDADTQEEDDGKVFSKFLKYAQLEIATDDDIISSWQRLRSKRDSVSQQEFKKWQQAAGLTFSDYALLSSAKLLDAGLLKPISLYCFDYMHALCSHGIMNDTIFLVFEQLQCNSGLKAWDTLKDWISFWSFPKAYSNSNFNKLFDSKNIASSRKAKTFKCEGASDILALYKPLQHFLQVMFVANNVMVHVCQCFLSWAQVLDYLVSLPFMASPCSAKILALVEEALAATVAAGFGDQMKPKHHWTLHFADCFRRWGSLPACWSLERKHKQPRKFGSSHCKLGTYEKGLLSAVSMEHINTLVENQNLFQTACHLVSPRVLTKKLEQILKDHQCFVPNMEYSNSCMLPSGTICHTKDVVFLQESGSSIGNWKCGQVQHFYKVAGLSLCMVDVFHFLGAKPNTLASKWQAKAHSLKLLNVQQLLQPAIHSYGQDGQVTCLVPAPLSWAA